MNIREQLSSLSQLGKADLKLKELKEKQKSIPAKANAAKDQSVDAKLREEKLKAEYQALELKRKQLELDTQIERTNLRKWEARASQIKGEREYTTLMSEIGSQKKVISKLEDQGLELLEQQETLKKTLDSMTAQKTSLEQTYESEWALVKDSLDALNAEFAQATTEHEASLAALPQPLAKRYIQIAERRAGQGIAILNKDVCGACKRILPPELCNRIAKGEIIETCPSCHRLLVSA